MTKTTATIIHILCLITLVLLTTPTFSQSSIAVKDTISNLLKTKKSHLDRFLWSYAQGKAQKGRRALIDFNVIDKWQGLAEYYSLSHNGKYIAYATQQGIGLDPIYQELDSLIVQSTDNSWRYAMTNTNPGVFTNDSKKYIYQNKGNLYLLKLGTSEAKSIEGVSSYKISSSEKDQCLAYQLNSNTATLVLLDLTKNTQANLDSVTAYDFDISGQWIVCKAARETGLLVYHLNSGKQKFFYNVVNYTIDNNGSTLILQTTSKENLTVLKYINLLSGSEKNIWQSPDTTFHIGNYCLDRMGTQVAFSITKNGTNGIWYYKRNMKKAMLMVTNQSSRIESRLQIDKALSFTDNGHYIQFSLHSPSLSKPEAIGAQLDVWSYKDLAIQSSQVSNEKQSQSYIAVVNIEKSMVLQLDKITTSLIGGDYAFIKKHSKEKYGDRIWDSGHAYKEDSAFVISLKDGNRHLLPAKGIISHPLFSPNGRYLVYVDIGNRCDYFSYDLQSGKKMNISRDLADWQLAFFNPYLITDKKPDYPCGLAGWLHNDVGVLVYDNNDIWQLDLRGKLPAINITRGFGRSNGVVFSLIDNHRFQSNATVQFKVKNEPILLMGYNSENKQSGFFRTTTGVSSDPEILNLGPYFFCLMNTCQDGNLSAKGIRPEKAQDANKWIIQRQSTSDAPNYYLTEDFKLFNRLTNYQPQADYFWITEELQSFAHLNGKKGQGILYKPQDFDTSKKYPVLIVFYGGFSNNMYQFPVPAYNSDAITPGKSPIWFLNNGYLVFTPDIYVSPPNYGPDAFNVIEGAAQYLKTLPYVDSNSLGVCSHSWSAKLGAYLFTHSRSFAATAISEGFLYAN